LATPEKQPSSAATSVTKGLLQRDYFRSDKVLFIYSCIVGATSVDARPLVDRTENVSRARHTWGKAISRLPRVQPPWNLRAAGSAREPTSRKEPEAQSTVYRL